jgi:hypothetical protein
MKKIFILLLLPTLMFSQKKDETVVRLDSLQAKIIALELVDCEFIRKELSLISTILEKTEDKIALKDAIIKIMEDERIMVDKILESKDELLANVREQIRLLEKINKREKTKKWVNKAVYLGAGIAATYLLLK